MHRRVAFLALFATATACGHDSNEPGGSIRLEAAQAVTVGVGPAGGQLRTTDSQGRI